MAIPAIFKKALPKIPKIQKAKKPYTSLMDLTKRRQNAKS